MQNGVRFFFFKKGVKKKQFALQMLPALSKIKAERERILLSTTPQSATVMQLFTMDMLSDDRLKREELSSVDPRMNFFNFQI